MYLPLKVLLTTRLNVQFINVDLCRIIIKLHKDPEINQKSGKLEDTGAKIKNNE